MLSARDFVLLNLTLLLWAGYYVAGRFALEALPPFLLTSLRFLMVAMILLPFVSKPTFPQKQVLIISFFLGTLSFGLGLAALAWGLDVPTTILVGQLAVPFSCMFGAIMLGDRLGPWRSSGLVVAMLGVMIISGSANVITHFWAFIALLIGTAAWAFANVLMKQMGAIKIMPFLAWMSLYAGLQLLVISLIFEDISPALLDQMNLQVIGSLLYLALGSTLLAYWLWYYLLQRYLASQVTPYTMLGPFYGFFLGWVVLGEELTTKVMIGGAVTLIGVGIIVMRRPRLAMLGKVRPTVQPMADEPQNTQPIEGEFRP